MGSHSAHGRRARRLYRRANPDIAPIQFTQTPPATLSIRGEWSAEPRGCYDRRACLIPAFS